MRFFTGKGDEGETSLFNGDIRLKSHLVFDLIGALDEATAQLGMAISLCDDDSIKMDLTTIQNHLSKFMGIIAGASQAVIGAQYNMLKVIDWIETRIKFYGKQIDNPKGFLYAGKTQIGAAVDIARTVIRKAERVYTKLIDEKPRDNPSELVYLNRLSSFLYILRLFVDCQANPTK